MLSLRPVAIAATAVLLSPSAFALAQGISFGDLFKPNGIPTQIKVSGIPADMHAVSVQTSGSSGSPMDAFTGYWPLMLMGSMMSSQNNQAPQEAALMGAMEMMGVSWTKGDVVSVQGHDYLVTYKMSLSLAGLSSGPPTFPDHLDLMLVRNDYVQSIQPKPDITPESYANAFGAVSAMHGAQAQAATATAGGFAGTAGTTGSSGELRSLQTQTESNAKQLALGMLMYTSDWDDILPYAQDTKAAYYITQPYIKNTSTTKTLNPNGGMLRLNMSIAGVNSAKIPNPADTPMYYDSLPWPDGRYVVAFCDGHVKLVDSTEWKKLLKYVSRKLPKAAKPLPASYGRHWGEVIK